MVRRACSCFLLGPLRISHDTCSLLQHCDTQSRFAGRCVDFGALSPRVTAFVCGKLHGSQYGSPLMRHQWACLFARALKRTFRLRKLDSDHIFLSYHTILNITMTVSLLLALLSVSLNAVAAAASNAAPDTIFLHVGKVRERNCCAENVPVGTNKWLARSHITLNMLMITFLVGRRWQH